MSSFTIKVLVPVNQAQRNSQPETAVSRKKRRLTNDDEDDYNSSPKSKGNYLGPSSSGRGRQRQNRSQPPDPENLFEDDLDVDVISAANGESSPPRSPSPAAVPVRKRGKKKAATVYSDDDEDDFVDSGKKQNDNDDDFVVDSPPRKAGRKGGVGGAKGRGKNAKEKGGGIGEITMKDERKGVASNNDAKTGAKRRRETVSEPKGDVAIDVESFTATSITQSSSTASAIVTSQSQEDVQPQPPPPKVRKLPTIKKNKPPVASTSTAPSAGPSTPTAPGLTDAKAGATSEGLPTHASLPRKPPIHKKTADVDLFSPDIYNSLFNKGGSASRGGVNSKLKDEERRKELMKMRDEARAARVANLQKNTFDLLAGQEKVARFEAALRGRNSTAVYPNHLGAALRLFTQRRADGLPLGYRT